MELERIFGIIVGSTVGIINVVWIRRLVRKTVEGQGAGIQFFLKLLVLGAVVIFSLGVLKVEALGFLIGFSVVVLALVLKGLRTVL